MAASSSGNSITTVRVLSRGRVEAERVAPCLSEESMFAFAQRVFRNHIHVVVVEAFTALIDANLSTEKAINCIDQNAGMVVAV